MEHSNINTFKNHNGFTLIEVLIAITILSFIALSTFVMVDSNLTTREVVTKEDSLLLQTVTAINRIDSDFSQLYSPLYYSVKNITVSNDPSAAYSEEAEIHNNNMFDGTTKSGAVIPQIISDNKSTLIFLSLANRRKFANSKESRFSWIKYQLKAMVADPDDPDDKSSGRFQLIRQTISTDIYNADKDWDLAKDQPLMDHIKELEFSFWDSKAKKFTTNLQDLNEAKFAPRMLKTKITWIDLDDKEQIIEKVSRVLNPYFDTIQDDVESRKNKNSQNTGLPTPKNPGNEFSGASDEDDDEVSDEF